jgi:hypothetical protein
VNQATPAQWFEKPSVKAMLELSMQEAKAVLEAKHGPGRFPEIQPGSVETGLKDAQK